MSEREIRRKIRFLKTDSAKYNYLKGISNKARMLKKETKKAFYKIFGDYALKTDHSGDAQKAYLEGGNIAADVGAKEEALEYAKKLADIGDYEDAGNIAADVGAKEEALEYAKGVMKKNKYGYDEAIGIQVKVRAIDEAISLSNSAPWASHLRSAGIIRKAVLEYAEESAKSGDYSKAVELASKIGASKEAVKYARTGIDKSKNTLENVVTSILAFGGIGLLFSFFSKPNVISAQNVQLAPPFPNYMVYIFAVMLIGGIGYFLVKKFKK